MNVSYSKMLTVLYTGIIHVGSWSFRDPDLRVKRLILTKGKMYINLTVSSNQGFLLTFP